MKKSHTSLKYKEDNKNDKCNFKQCTWVLNELHGEL